MLHGLTESMLRGREMKSCPGRDESRCEGKRIILGGSGRSHAGRGVLLADYGNLKIHSGRASCSQENWVNCDVYCFKLQLEGIAGSAGWHSRGKLLSACKFDKGTKCSHSEQL